MKKRIFLILAAIICAFPLVVNAESYKSENLRELVADEINIFGSEPSFESYISTLKSVDLSGYTPSRDKVTIYFFRGASCSHCLDAATFFASIYPEYGDLFDVVSYEVWNDPVNLSLGKKVVKTLNNKTFEGAVPYIVIGEKTFDGYSSSMNDQIINLIKTYSSGSSYVDAVQGIIDGTYKKSDNKVLTICVLVIAAAIVVLIIVGRNNTTYYETEEVKEEPVVKKEPEKKVVKKEPKKVETKKTTTKKTTAKKTTKKTK